MLLYKYKCRSIHTSKCIDSNRNTWMCASLFIAETEAYISLTQKGRNSQSKVEKTLDGAHRPQFSSGCWSPSRHQPEVRASSLSRGGFFWCFLSSCFFWLLQVPPLPSLGGSPPASHHWGCCSGFLCSSAWSLCVLLLGFL